MNDEPNWLVTVLCDGTLLRCALKQVWLLVSLMLCSQPVKVVLTGLKYCPGIPSLLLLA